MQTSCDPGGSVGVEIRKREPDRIGRACGAFVARGVIEVLRESDAGAR